MTGAAGKVAVGLSVIGMAAAMATPTPLLQARDVRTSDRLYPGTEPHDGLGYALPQDQGGLRIESDAVRRGCVQLVSRDGRQVGPLCNRHLVCDDPAVSAGRPTRLEVFRGPQPGTYYAETGSACNSTCCDWQGVTFGADGARLDDGLLDRVLLRWGILGAAAWLMGVTAVAWAAVRKRSNWVLQAVAISGSGASLFLLWWNR